MWLLLSTVFLCDSQSAVKEKMVYIVFTDFFKNFWWGISKRLRELNYPRWEEHTDVTPVQTQRKVGLLNVFLFWWGVISGCHLDHLAWMCVVAAGEDSEVIQGDLMVWEQVQLQQIVFCRENKILWAHLVPFIGWNLQSQNARKLSTEQQS